MKSPALILKLRNILQISLLTILFLGISFIISCDVSYDLDWNTCTINESVLKGNYMVADDCSMPYENSVYEINIKMNTSIEGLCGYFYISNLFKPDSLGYLSLQYFSYLTPHIYVPEQEYQGWIIKGDGSINDGHLTLNLDLKRDNENKTCTVTGNLK